MQDILYGGFGVTDGSFADRDSITGSDANDLIIGGLGEDVAFFNSVRSDFAVSKANGIVTVEHLNNGMFGTDTLINVEFLWFGDGAEPEANDVVGVGDAGSVYDDLLVGTGAGDILFAGGGADTVTGDDGADRLFGQTDDDSLFGGADADRLFGHAGNDLLDGGGAADTLFGGNDADSLLGGPGGDTLFGGNDADSLDGGSGGDAVWGQDGADTVAGGDDADTLTGGLGDDTLLGGAGADIFAFSPGPGTEVDRIGDFIVGADALRLLGGLTIAGTAEADLDGDGTAGTTVTLSSGDQIELLGVNGIVDPNVLLE